jgi:glucan biosynthesis protein C
MLGVFFFHNARFFDDVDWHVKDADHSEVAFVFVAFLNVWLMPLLMLVAGAGSWFSLQSRAGGNYLIERAKRLLVPLYTVGFLVLIPPQYYLDQVTHGRFGGSLLESYPSFLGTLELRPGPDFLNFWSGHVWFLRFLFLYSLLGLPLLLYLKSEAGRRWICRLSGWCDWPGGILLFALPLALAHAGLRPLAAGDHGIDQFIGLLVFFVSGVLLVADARFTRAIQRAGRLCLFLGAASFVCLGYVVLGRGYNGWQHPDHSLSCVTFHAAGSLCTWCWLVFFLDLASRRLNVGSRLLSYANEAVLPFYLLHQTVILAVGWYVVPWHTSIALKYAVITVSSFTIIMGLYELLIRRANVCRAFFGMRMKKRAP